MKKIFVMSIVLSSISATTLFSEESSTPDTAAKEVSNQDQANPAIVTSVPPVDVAPPPVTQQTTSQEEDIKKIQEEKNPGGLKVLTPDELPEEVKAKIDLAAPVESV